MKSENRLARTRAWLETNGFDAFVAKNTSNIAWLTGFEGTFDYEQAHVAIVTRSGAWFYTDSRYTTVASLRAEGTPWEVVLELDDRPAAVAERLASVGAKRIAAEDTVSVAAWKKYEEAVDGELVATDAVIETLRSIKEPEEIESIAAAQAITDAAFTHMLGFLKAGMTERQIALELEFWMRSNGSDGVAFDGIIASGPNSAMPHASVTDRVIEPGDFLVMDFGARVNGYCSDMTRTVLFGTATEEQRAIYDTVLAANLAGIAGCRAGVKGKDIDATARAVIDAAGHADHFQHGLGHGVGLDIHELPNCGSRSEPLVLAGAVVTVEPGIYLPGVGGVRIEDLVVVEDGGCRVLTTSTKELIEL